MLWRWRRLSLIGPIIFLITFLAFHHHFCSAEIADQFSVPRGTNPTLYDAEDLVVQLDDQSFNDTVFCTNTNNGTNDALQDNHCTAMVVEFYSDWCGHCRAYARTYKALARDLRNWAGVLRLAAINCADPVNLIACRASGITHYPYIKYYPRNSSVENASADGQLLRAYQSLTDMRDQFTRALLAEWEETRYADWPNFEPLGEVETYAGLWEGIETHIRTLVVVFEREPDQGLVGAQLLLDLAKYRDRIVARRCSADNALVSALQIVDLPTFVVFRRGERSPVFIAELRRLLLAEFEQYLHNDTLQLPTGRTFSRRKGLSVNGEADPERVERECEAEPERCRKAYFVSELDMLKSVRIALFNDMHLADGAPIAGSNLSALYNFVDVLANHFPHTTEQAEQPTDNDAENRTIITAERFLNASGRARVVFSHLRDFIGDSGGPDAGVSVDAWRAEFLRAEADQGNPFPVAEEWEHCKGSSPVLRGFTCGLWMVFHALTVSAYRNGNPEEVHPVALLHAFRDWVGAFFGCEHCRAHFLRMTTKTAKIEALVRRREDVFLYLWKAHNLVNGRLKGRDTEDPQFPKYQFPPRFLCPECHPRGGGGKFDETELRNFLLRFYARIRPYNKDAEHWQPAEDVAGQPRGIIMPEVVATESTEKRVEEVAGETPTATTQHT